MVEITFPFSIFPFLFQQRIDFFSPTLPVKAFEKASTVQMSCSEGAPLRCMVMRDVQLNELCELEEHSDGGAGAKLQNV